MTGPPRAPSPSPSIDTTADTTSSHVTTPQLVGCIEEAIGVRLDEGTLDEFLLQLDRGQYVEWVRITRSGDYVWDLSESPDRVADAIAAGVGDRVRAWLDDRTD